MQRISLRTRLQNKYKFLLYTFYFTIIYFLLLVCNSITCNGRGTCKNTGECLCDSNFNGTHCDQCKPGFYGPNCDQGKFIIFLFLLFHFANIYFSKQKTVMLQNSVTVKENVIQMENVNVSIISMVPIVTLASQTFLVYHAIFVSFRKYLYVLIFFL